jgi:hypothetical protein
MPHPFPLVSPVESSPTAFVGTLPAIMSIPEACQHSRLSRAFLYKAIKAGALQTVKRGKRRLVFGCDLAAYLSADQPTRSVGAAP